MRGYKVTTNEKDTYQFMVHSGKLCSIFVDEGETSTRFYVEENNAENFIPMDIFERAMEALLRERPEAFDVVSLVAHEPYNEASVKVYKKVMDELYNLAIADVAFERHSSSIEKAVNATYTLFKE